MKTDPPASLISDGYIIDLTPWWRHYLNMLNPFRRRRSKAVPMEDAMILVNALTLIAAGVPHHTFIAKRAIKKFTAKHQLP
jgi:hypothetical protein